MERIREKEEMIERNPQCREESDGKDLFSLLPLDLKKEILLKSPRKSIANLISVSKSWSSIIRNQGFTKLYLTRSSYPQRFLIYFATDGMQFFHSCSLIDRSSSSDHHTVNITQRIDTVYQICKPIRGLICYFDDTQVLIRNPSTGQFVSLPQVQTSAPLVNLAQCVPIKFDDHSIIERGLAIFFGYEPDNDVYKVLCMTVDSNLFGTESVVSEEHQVFTIGAKQKWRRIQCKHPHQPYSVSAGISKGICKNGVLYYSAWINDEVCLISFDLRSEDFDVIKFPEDQRRRVFCNLVNYYGRIALANQEMDGKLDIWVLEDGSKKEWLKVSVLGPSWRDLVGGERFLFRGVILTGELIFTPYETPSPFYILCYDLKENSARKVVIEGIIKFDYSIQVFVDYEESRMILPEVS